MKEDKWCKKVVCGCTHKWMNADETRQRKICECTVEGDVCKLCGYWPWIYKYPTHYSKYKKRAKV